LKDVQPFCLYSLTVYFLEQKYHDLFCGILSRGMKGNPHSTDDESACPSEKLEPLLDIKVSSIEDMPFSKAMQL
jgi:hypothetical protein